jgi:3-oxoacyl-[acyl-carrier-protein] synthase-3
LNSPIFLHNIAYSVGTKEPIAGLDVLIADDSLLGTLTAMGLDSYRQSNAAPAELARQAAAKTLAESSIRPDAIDAVVYATSSFQRRAWYMNDFGVLCERLMLTHVTGLGVFLAECGNFASALRVARGLLLGEGLRNVLLIVSDVCLAPSDRIVAPGISVLSDGAASCIVSSVVPSSLEILALHQESDQRIRNIEMSRELVKALKFTADGLARLTDRVLQDLHLPREAVGRLITNNYSLSTLRLFAVQTGFSLRMCYTDLVPEFAHVFAADALINLSSYASAATDRAPGPEVVLLLCTGQCTWGVCAVRITRQG